jgi:hypothetical protein
MKRRERACSQTAPDRSSVIFYFCPFGDAVVASAAAILKMPAPPAFPHRAAAESAGRMRHERHLGMVEMSESCRFTAVAAQGRSFRIAQQPAKFTHAEAVTQNRKVANDLEASSDTVVQARIVNCLELIN